MSESHVHAEPAHAGPAHAEPVEVVHGPGEHAHPQAMTYIVIAVILCVLTLAEIGVFYVGFNRLFLALFLFVLAGAKFGLVVAFYMHLKFDSKLFTSMFFLGMGIAVAILIALALLFFVFHG